MKNKINISGKEKFSPFVYKNTSISLFSIKMLVLLFIQVLLLIFTKSYAALYVVLACFSGALIVSIVNIFVFKTSFYTNSTFIIQGILIGMLLPESYPLATAFCLVLIILSFEKFYYFDSVNNWLNVVCFAVAIAWFIGRDFFPDFLITRDILSVKNPSSYMIQNGVFPVYSFDTKITGFLNGTIFSVLKVNLPTGYISMLWDSHSVIPAFRFNLVTILSSVILFAQDDYILNLIRSLFVIVYAVLVRLFFPLMNGGAFNQGDILLALLTSGTLFFAVFIINWYGTYPVTPVGKILYAIFCGVTAFFVVGCGTSPIGMVYTVLICNILNLIIRLVEEKNNQSRILRIVTNTIESGELK
ncbi:MAG: RnfABCDGE type electron transport complex subunit D [Treponema sp.]|nr:RnfABCDGE type electron transport complex subunit D [Treponema sp.]